MLQEFEYIAQYAVFFIHYSVINEFVFEQNHLLC